MSRVLTRPMASPSSEITGRRSTLCTALKRNASSIGVSGRTMTALASGTMTSAARTFRKSNNDYLGENQQAENVREVCHQQDGDEEPFRPFRQAIQAERSGPTLLYLVTKPHRIDREQPGFNAREKERDGPEQENDDAVDHVAVAPSPSCSGSRQAVFSSSISSIRFRPARRIVTASRGISKRVPEGGR